MNKITPITISEYDSFVLDKEIPGYTTLSKKTFETLENFILNNRNKDTDALEIMSLSAKKGIGKVITAKNYVGIISLKDGTTIEILPKIYSKEQENIKKVKKLLISMLKSLRNSPCKTLQSTNLNIEKMNIFEIFIRMFIDEVMYIAKRGLKSDYQTITSNQNVLKGKLVFNENIKTNLVHKERFFVEYDEFNNDRAENRLIKSTLQYLYKQTTFEKNKNYLRTLLNIFSDVNLSSNYDDDFSKVVDDRNMKDYKNALLWSKVFLKGKSFTSFAGSDVATALLFPMNDLFESYVALKLKQALNPNEYRIHIQDKKCHLFDTPQKFLIKPDIVVEKDKNIFILDTKWKILNKDAINYGISQMDMYQMYAYQKKYMGQKVILLYPLSDKVEDDELIEYKSGDGVIIDIKFINLFDISNSIKNIISIFNV